MREGNLNLRISKGVPVMELESFIVMHSHPKVNPLEFIEADAKAMKKFVNLKPVKN